MTTTILYPTPDQVQLVVRWSNQGPQALDPDNGTPDRIVRGRDKNKARVGNLARMRDLIFRLDLPFQYETMRAEILYRPVAGVDVRLLRQLVGSLRLHGYVYETGRMRLDCTAPLYAVTPLTGHQLHIVRMYASGMSTREIAHFFDVDTNRVSAAVRRAKSSLGIDCEGRDRLIAGVFQHGWLPTYREHQALLESELPPVGKPYRTVAGWDSLQAERPSA